jgi:ketosteroid isomerase-like protein
MRPLLVRLSALAAIAALLTSCASARGSATAADVAAVRTARADQNRAIAEGDAGRIASFWTDDVTVRSGLGILVTGRAAYRERIVANGPAGGRLVYVRNPASIVVSNHWPLAFESGTWTARLGDVQGAEVMGGRYSAQWVKRDGRWLIRSEVFVALTCSASGCDAGAVP